MNKSMLNHKRAIGMISFLALTICFLALMTTMPTAQATAQNSSKDHTPHAAKFHVGDTVNFTITVDVLDFVGGPALSISNLTISDPLPVGETFVTGSNTSTPSSSFIAYPNGTLFWDFGPGPFVTSPQAVVSYNITVASGAPAGFLVDIATITYDETVSGVHSAPAISDFVFIAKPSITLMKTPSASKVENGSSVTYTYNVTNTGNVALTVNLTDDTFGPIFTGKSMAAGASNVTTISRILIANMTNIATATGVDQNGASVNAQATAFVQVIHPKISLTKTPSASKVENGSSVTYTYNVTNTEDTSLIVSLTDNTFPSPIFTGKVLAPGASSITTLSHMLTVSTTNIATATGVDQMGASVSADATATVQVIHPAITLTKTASPSTPQLAPANFTYTYIVTNIGDVALSGVTIYDQTFNQLILGPVPLSVSQSATGTWGPVTYPNVTASYTNYANATGTDQNGTSVEAFAQATVSTYTAGAPVACWKFDEGSGSVAHDSSGHGNNGTITGAEWVSGIAGSALRFRDSSTYVTMTKFPDGLEGNTEFTVSFWVNINTWPTAQYAYLILFGATADDQAFHVLLDNDDGYGPYGTVRATFWNRHVWTEHTFSTGIWYNWAFVYDKTKVTMYQNGTFLEDISLGGAVPNLDPSGTLWVSGPNTNSTQPFDGIIDEIAIYNYARTAQDILSDYNSVSRVRVDVSAVSVTIGQTFDVAVRVSSVSDLYLWVFSVQWNPTILGYVSIAEGDFLGRGGSTTGVLVKSVNQTGGCLEEATCSLLGNVPGVGGDGILATITFRAVGLGSSPVSIAFHDLIDSNGSSIQSDSVDGTVNVTAPDLSIVEVNLPYPTLAKYMNMTMPMNVTIQNMGTAVAGAFNVSFTAYWNDGGLLEHYEEQRITSLETNTTTTINLHFTPRHSGSYTLTFEVDCNDEVVESNETNNQLSLSIVVNILGDITGDGQVTYRDLFVLARAYWSTPADPNWNPVADINYDGIVDYRDLFLLSRNYSS